MVLAAQLALLPLADIEMVQEKQDLYRCWFEPGLIVGNTQKDREQVQVDLVDREFLENQVYLVHQESLVVLDNRDSLLPL